MKGNILNYRRRNIEPIDIARLIVDVIADKKGEDIILMEVREQTTIADYFVICTATNERQLKAIVEAIREKVKEEFSISSRPVEGKEETGWILIDFVDIVVHAFQREVRQKYDLEDLWRESPVLLKMQ